MPSSGYLRKENVVSIALPFAYHGLAHYAGYLKNSHRNTRTNKPLLPKLQKLAKIGVVDGVSNFAPKIITMKMVC